MGKLAVWLIGLLLLSLIYAACVHFRVNAIEYDLKDRATVALVNNDHSWARVAVDGRDIILAGIAPDENAQINAERVIKAIRGVRAVGNLTAVVKNDSTPPEPEKTRTVTAKPEPEKTSEPEVTQVTPPTVQTTSQSPESVSPSTPVEQAPSENLTLIDSCQQEINNLLADQRIEFGIASWEIDERSYALLNDLIDWLKTCPNTRVEVGGHTDSIGEEQENISLSLARAEAVAHYLQRSGIRGTRLSAVGYGSALPIDTNQTSEGRKRNRRIEIQITR